MVHINSRADIGSRVKQINRLYSILIAEIKHNVFCREVSHYSDPRCNCMMILGVYATHSSQLLWVRRIDRQLGPFSLEQNMILSVSNNLIVDELGSTFC